MAESDTILGLSQRRCWQIVDAIRALLGLVTGYALVTANFGLLTNALVPLAFTFLPELVRRQFEYQMDAGLALWITTAAILHAIGALGVYRTLGWYDQIAHTFSSTLVAGAGYAVVDALDNSGHDVDVPSKFRFLFIVIFVLAFGVLWEIAEFASSGLATLIGGEPILAQYGVSDIVLDLAFNAVGAVLIALWGTGYFAGLSRLLARRFDRPKGSS